MTRSEAPATTNYTLNKRDGRSSAKRRSAPALKRLAPLMADEKRSVALAFVAMLVTSASALLGPVIIGRTVDTYIRNGNFAGVLRSPAILLAVYLVRPGRQLCPDAARWARVGRRVLFKLRNALFTKLQELPLAFFNQNKAGDLISRINNDTDKLNQFFAQALVQFAGNLFLMTGAAILLLALNFRLGAGGAGCRRSAC